MLKLFDNWYQLVDNGLYDKPTKGVPNPRALALLCLGAKARLLYDNDTVVICTAQNGFKLKLSWHDTQLQDDIIDAIYPALITL